MGWVARDEGARVGSGSVVSDAGRTVSVALQVDMDPFRAALRAFAVHCVPVDDFYVRLVGQMVAEIDAVPDHAPFGLREMVTHRAFARTVGIWAKVADAHDFNGLGALADAPRAIVQALRYERNDNTLALALAGVRDRAVA